MAQHPQNTIHAGQIEAGHAGRRKGHDFEQVLADLINSTAWARVDVAAEPGKQHLYVGNPALALLGHIARDLGLRKVDAVTAHCLGGLATDKASTSLLDGFGKAVSKSKCDVLLQIHADGVLIEKGISVKSCNNRNPTNAQLYFTTADAFLRLLQENNIPVGAEVREGLKMFCGDAGYRPCDTAAAMIARLSDPNRYYWEELPLRVREQVEQLFMSRQVAITRLLIQKAYKGDAFAPEYIIHKTRKAASELTEVAVYSIQEFLDLSSSFAGFQLRPYFIRKGTYKHDPHEHLAPWFGVVQMQRAGTKQNPTQLQFNLQAGYFYKLQELAHPA